MPNITNDNNIKAWTDGSSNVLSIFNDEGDFCRQYMLNPAIFSLLGDIKNKTILDAGCGQGYLSRLMAKQKAIVTGLEPAVGLIDYAIERERNEKLGITYIKDDLSFWNQKPNSFDIVVSNMVFMDIPDWKSAMNNCITALKVGGIFIFSISHPCFDKEEMKDYFSESEEKNPIGYSFHHTLSDYLNLVIDKGCNIKKILEPKLSNEVHEQDNAHERSKYFPNFILVKSVKS